MIKEVHRSWVPPWEILSSIKPRQTTGLKWCWQERLEVWQRDSDIQELWREQSEWAATNSATLRTLILSKIPCKVKTPYLYTIRQPYYAIKKGKKSLKMADRTRALLCVKSRMKDRSDGLLKVMRQWPERKNFPREKSGAALGEEKAHAMAVFINAKTKGQIQKWGQDTRD